MSPSEVQEVAREAIVTLIMVCGPAMIVALAIGLLISLFQALTSIQEVTLTFVPKIILVFITLLVFMPFMADRMQILMEDMFVRMAKPPQASPLETGEV